MQDLYSTYSDENTLKYSLPGLLVQKFKPTLWPMRLRSNSSNHKQQQRIYRPISVKVR